jgi:hypothetical protein
MKKKAIQVALRAGMIILCLSFIGYTPARVSSERVTTTTLPCPAVDLKSETQLRSEASRYDSAVRVIGGIATMKLATVGDLKKAIDIVNREHPNLRFRFSKLIVLAISDPTFSSAVKARTAAGSQAAEAFLREIQADPKTILRLTGAEPLKTRLQRTDEANAATLRRTADRFKAIAKKLGNATPLLPVTSERPTAIAYEERLERALVAGAVIAGPLLATDFPLLFEIAEEKLCLREASDRYQKCLAENPPPPTVTDLESLEAALLSELLNPLGGRAGCLHAFLYDQLACSNLPF